MALTCRPLHHLTPPSTSRTSLPLKVYRRDSVGSCCSGWMKSSRIRLIPREGVRGRGVVCFLLLVEEVLQGEAVLRAARDGGGLSQGDIHHGLLPAVCQATPPAATTSNTLSCQDLLDWGSVWRDMIKTGKLKTSTADLRKHLLGSTALVSLTLGDECWRRGVFPIRNPSIGKGVLTQCSTLKIF